MSCVPFYFFFSEDLPQHVYNTDVLTDQQLCNEESISSLDQEETVPLPIKEEHEEHCFTENEEQLLLKQETDTFMVPCTNEESDDNEPKIRSDQFICHSSPGSKNHYQEVDNRVDTSTKLKPKKRQHRNKGYNVPIRQSECNITTGKKRKWQIKAVWLIFPSYNSPTHAFMEITLT